MYSYDNRLRAVELYIKLSSELTRAPARRKSGTPGTLSAVRDLIPGTIAGLSQTAAHRTASLDRQFELVPRVEALHLARRRAAVVPEPGMVAVGIEDQRPLALHLLQAICVQLGLLLADVRVLQRALGLNDGQRFAVSAPEHVIDEALALLVRHPGDRHLDRRLLATSQPASRSSTSMKCLRVSASL